MLGLLLIPAMLLLASWVISFPSEALQLAKRYGVFAWLVSSVLWISLRVRKGARQICEHSPEYSTPSDDHRS